jgi:4-hydroxyphenylpyruvate dioxygenase
MKSTLKSTDLLYIHHVNFYVDDANLWKKWFEFYLDFQAIASKNINHTQIEILQQGKIQIHISAALNLHSPVAKYLKNHPQGIGEIGFAVKGTIPDLIPDWGDVIHKFVQVNLASDQEENQENIHQNHLKQSSSKSGLSAIDHIVINVPHLQLTAAWYSQNMGLDCGDRFSIHTETSALRSIVMRSPDCKIQIPINEPSTPNSQIQEFLNFNSGSGVQHLALLTDDIYATVAKLKLRGVEFLETIPSILVEQQDEHSGQKLMQIFTKPIFNEPTFFFEIIQRQNKAQGFGEKNFQALFEAVERQQFMPTH